MQSVDYLINYIFYIILNNESIQRIDIDKFKLWWVEMTQSCNS